MEALPQGPDIGVRAGGLALTLPYLLHAAIQALLWLRDETSSCCSDVRSKVIETKLQFEARIKSMKAMSRALDELIAECSDCTRPIGDCSIRAALSAARETGAR